MIDRYGSLLHVMLLSEAFGRFHVDVAFGRTTWQSTTYATADSKNAVDGDIATCASTYQSTQDQPWWVVDLGTPSYVSGVILTNPPQALNGMTNWSDKDNCCRIFTGPSFLYRSTRQSRMF